MNPIDQITYKSKKPENRQIKSNELFALEKNRYYSGVEKLCVVVMVFSTMLLSYLPVGNDINLIFSIFIVLLIIFKTISSSRPVWIGAEIIMLLVWVAFAILPSFFAIAPDYAILKLITMVQLSVLSMIVINVALWIGDVRPFMWAFGLAAVASFALSFTPLSGIEFGTRAVGEVAGRTVGTLRNANTFGVVMVEAMFIMSCLLVMTNSHIKKIIILFSILLLALAVFKSGSRTAVLGLIVLLFIFAWSFNVFNIRRPKLLFGSFLFAAIIVGYGVYNYNENIETKKRYDALFSVIEAGDVKAETTANSLKGRAAFAALAWELATKEKPFGIGLDNFKVYAGKYSHSNFMEILASTGFVGMVIYYVIYIFIYIRAKKISWKNKKQKTMLRLLMMYPLLVGIMDITNVSYYSKNTWLTFAMVIASLELIRTRNKINSSLAT